MALTLEQVEAEIEKAQQSLRYSIGNRSLERQRLSDLVSLRDKLMAERRAQTQGDILSRARFGAPHRGR